MANIEIIRYQSIHHRAVLDLQKRLWSPSVALNQSYFRWKYIDNPHAQFGAIFLALVGGQIVGMRGFMGTLWTDPGGAPVAIPLAGDTVVAAQYEGHGIVKRLSEVARSEFARRDIHFVLSLSSSPPVFFHSRRSGWKTIGCYTYMRRRARHHRREKLARKLQGSGLIPVRSDSDPFAASDGANWPVDRQTTISLDTIADPVAFSDLNKAAPRLAKFTMVRDLPFFRWRFTNPLSTYYFLTCRKNRDLVAYLTLGVGEQETGHVVSIVDWNSLDWPIIPRLLETLDRRFPDTPVNVYANGFTAAERRDLGAVGFREVIDESSQVTSLRKYQPSALAIRTARDDENDCTVRDLTKHGFALLEFKGIESDGA